MRSLTTRVTAGALATAVLGVAAAALYTPVRAQRAAAPLALVGVNVLPMDQERVLRGQTLVIRDGRIAAMGPAGSVQVPADAEVVKLEGKYVLPGLGEMHGHLAGPNASMNERILTLNVAHGILTVRSMMGHPAQLDLRERVAKGELLGPRIYTSGPSANGGSVQTPEQGAQMAREQKQAGYDLIKIHPGVPLAAFNALAKTAHEVGIPFAGHVPAAVGLRRALEARYSSIDHLDGYAEAAVKDGVNVSQSGFFGTLIAQHLDDSKIPALVKQTKDAGVWVVPTETLMINFLSEVPPAQSVARAEMAWLPAEMKTNWQNSRRDFQNGAQFSTKANRERLMAFRSALLKEMQKQGVGILLGADAPQVNNIPGLSTLEELEAVVKAGLTPYEALVSGTRAVAVYLGTEKDTGTVATGKQADLVVLDANPLDDIANAHKRAGVVLNGRWHSRAALDTMLEGLKR